MGFLAGFVFFLCMPKGRIDGSERPNGRWSRRSLALPRRGGAVDTDGVAKSSGTQANAIYTQLGSDEDEIGGDRQALLRKSGTNR